MNAYRADAEVPPASCPQAPGAACHALTHASPPIQPPTLPSACRQLPPLGTLTPRKKHLLCAGGQSCRAVHKSPQAMLLGASWMEIPKSRTPLQASSVITSARGLDGNSLSPKSILSHLISFTNGRCQEMTKGDKNRLCK